MHSVGSYETSCCVRVSVINITLSPMLYLSKSDRDLLAEFALRYTEEKLPMLLRTAEWLYRSQDLLEAKRYLWWEFGFVKRYIDELFERLEITERCFQWNWIRNGTAEVFLDYPSNGVY